MKNANMERLGGFTLIELLVVVLIIGILSAVALPQYEKAVNKARIATVKPVLKSLSDAWDVFWLASGGNVSCSSEECLTLLDIEVPQTKDFTFYLDEVICGSNGSCGAVISAENEKMKYIVDYFAAGYDGGGDIHYNNRFRCSAYTGEDEAALCSKLGAKYDTVAQDWFFE